MSERLPVWEFDYVVDYGRVVVLAATEDPDLVAEEAAARAVDRVAEEWCVYGVLKQRKVKIVEGVYSEKRGILLCYALNSTETPCE